PGTARSIGQQVVLKPLGPGHYIDGDTGRVVFARVLGRDAAELDLLDTAPFLVQQPIKARSHLRVVTVGEDIFTAQLDAEGLPLDWRQVPAAHRAFRPYDPSPVVASGAIALSQRLRLGYSSQDWILDESGRPWFLDLNPAGQWLFLPGSVADKITSAIAH